MPNDSTLAFVDTNVIVYAFSEQAFSDSRSEVARDLLARLGASNSVRLSTHVLLEFTAATLRNATRPETTLATAKAVQVISLWPVFQVDSRAILDAIAVRVKHQLSIWDALIVVSAKRSGAAILYTEDLNHGQTIEGVRIVNPFLAEVAPVNVP